jgi:ubiquinone/menaquinone biosynthesis C-methylase UbiE
MPEPLIIGIALLLLVAVCALGWWLLIETEGVYLGRHVVIWLYDIYAGRYDKIKQYDPEYEHILLARPIMGLIAPHRSPMVLDVATGTGRLPLALLDHRYFQGRIIATDLSRKMLAQAAEKLAEDGAHVDLVWCPAERLPFPDDCFDAVTCLESLEFMASVQVVVGELVRALRPGGLLLITNRNATRWMPGKTFTNETLQTMLESYGIKQVIFEPWQVDYQRVWGVKGGSSVPAGARPLAEVLRCPGCGGCFTSDNAAVLRCEVCGRCAQIGEDGVTELYPLYAAQ